MTATYDHTGMPSSEIKDGAQFIEPTRTWVTSPDAHPLKVQWLYFEPESPITGRIREEAHVAYRVDNLEEAIEGRELVGGPWEAEEQGRGFVRVAFVDVDGALVEYLHYPGSA